MKNPKPPYKEIFELARKAYPGVKRGLDTEFDYFRKKHRDWKDVLPLLSPVIKEQAEKWDKTFTAKQFIPHFKTWIFNRKWEETEGVTESPEEKMNREHFRIEQALQKKRQKIRDENQSYLESKSVPALLDLKKDKGQIWYICGWLIDEILEKRNKQRGS